MKAFYGNEGVGKTREGEESSAEGCHIFQEKTKVCECVPGLKQKSNECFCFLEGILKHRLARTQFDQLFRYALMILMDLNWIFFQIWVPLETFD